MGSCQSTEAAAAAGAGGPMTIKSSSAMQQQTIANNKQASSTSKTTTGGSSSTTTTSTTSKQQLPEQRQKTAGDKQHPTNATPSLIDATCSTDSTAAGSTPTPTQQEGKTTTTTTTTATAGGDKAATTTPKPSSTDDNNNNNTTTTTTKASSSNGGADDDRPRLDSLESVGSSYGEFDDYSSHSSTGGNNNNKATPGGGERSGLGNGAGVPPPPPTGGSGLASGGGGGDDAGIPTPPPGGIPPATPLSARGRTTSNSSSTNPKHLSHSTSAIGLDEMMESRREVGDLTQNVVHIEVPFGKPIEEVYDGVHNGPVLGTGISGLVRLVTHKATGLKYAVKVLDLGLVDTDEGLRQLREEIFIMCQLDHPNIVRLEEVYESHNEIYLVQELCLGGELFDRLDEQPDYHYTEGECARLVKQMLCAVRYLHSRGIIHRDLKLENFLFSSTSKDSELKMIDFGLSKHFHYGEVQREAVGTPYTVAPEVIKGCYDERCDIWAIGVITFLLLSGDPPFGGCGGPESLMTVRANILSGSFHFQPDDIWSNVSNTARKFIRALLVTDPSQRPTARQAQKHQWIVEWIKRNKNLNDPNGNNNDNVLNPNVVKALVNFKEFSDMRKLLCEVLSFTLLPDQIRELRREFEKMDTDGSGEISLSALKQVLMTNANAGSLGALTEEEVEDIFNAMRVRKTETRIHWHEFIAAGLSQCQVDDRNLRLAFDRLDSDHKGYIILEDIMDLMGGDALQSEEAMRRMWGDSIRAVKCQQQAAPRITYDDFLLLMKGQTIGEQQATTEISPIPEVVTSTSSTTSTSAVTTLMQSTLQAVPEVDFTSDGATTPEKEIGFEEEDIELAKYAESPTIPAAVGTTGIENARDIPNLEHKESSEEDQQQQLQMHSLLPIDLLKRSRSPSLFRATDGSGETSMSAPTTPADHKRILDIDDMESPLSMDEEDGSGGIKRAGGRNGNMLLAPPLANSLSGTTGGGSVMDKLNAANAVDRGMSTTSLPAVLEENGKSDVPTAAVSSRTIQKPKPYTRRRSRSVDDRDPSSMQESKDGDDEIEDAGNNEDTVERESESKQTESKQLDNNETKSSSNNVYGSTLGAATATTTTTINSKKSTLVVNRNLVRAHRHMRLAVMEACKRFEEQQAAHATEVILAQREEEEGSGGQVGGSGGSGGGGSGGMIQAGLVMRHGHKKQVSSESIRLLLKQNQEQQKELVEKANRRGGRGRRSRKKTISDMSGMLSSRPTPEQQQQQTPNKGSGRTPRSSRVAPIPSPPPPIAESKTLAVMPLASSVLKESSSDEALSPNEEDPTTQQLQSSSSSSLVVATPQQQDKGEITALTTSSTTTTDTSPEVPVAADAQMRKATVPGEFRKTNDPFGDRGLYGVSAALKKLMDS